MMKSTAKYWSRLLVMVGVILGLAVVAATEVPAAADDGVLELTEGVEILLPGFEEAAEFGGYAVLAGEWWNWATQFPIATNPILAEGEVDCSLGQSGDLWFLAGTFPLPGTGHVTTGATAVPGVVEPDYRLQPCIRAITPGLRSPPATCP